MVVFGTFVFTFILGYFGNFLFSAFIFRNNSEPAQWKEFINNERNLNPRQPLLSTTLNIIIAVVALVVILYYYNIISFFGITI